MKPTVIAASAVAAVLGTSALAMTPEELIQKLAAEGYNEFTVQIGGDEITIEGYKDGFEREIVLASDGDVLSDVMSQDHDDHDDDDGDDDDNDDEADGSDDDDANDDDDDDAGDHDDGDDDVEDDDSDEDDGDNEDGEDD